jgi:hypothetical protein
MERLDRFEHWPKFDTSKPSACQMNGLMLAADFDGEPVCRSITACRAPVLSTLHQAWRAPPYTSPKYMSTQHEIMPLIFQGMSNGKAGSAGYHACLPLW